MQRTRRGSEPSESIVDRSRRFYHEDRPVDSSPQYSSDELRLAFLRWLEMEETEEEILISDRIGEKSIDWMLNRLVGDNVMLTPDGWHLVNRWLFDHRGPLKQIPREALNTRPVSYGEAAELIMAVRGGSEEDAVG